jgi:cell pole-organizing protein PopZ
MSDANPQPEPSMEEILASIRRIISEDDEPGANAEEIHAEEASDEILELTEIAEEPEEEPAEEPAEEPEEEAAEEELSIDDVLNEVTQEEELELLETKDEPAAEAIDPVPEVPAAPVAAQLIDVGLLATETTTAAAGTLLGLVAAVDRAHGDSVLGDGNRTIEDLVKEVMRPMVKDWLDENLPGLTERLVRREIERLARHAEDD